MSIERIFQKDVARHSIDRKERAVRRPRPEPRRELTHEEIFDELSKRLSRLESGLNSVRGILKEIKEVLIAFGFEFEQNKKLAKVALRYRKKSRERWRRHKERHGDEK